MKTTKILLVLIIISGLLLISCSDKTTSPVSPTDQAKVGNLVTSLAKNGPIVHAVLGSANLRYLGKHISQTISAFEYQDGSFGGTYLQNAQNALDEKWQKWNGDVLFLKVYENVGEFGGKMGVIGGVEINGENAGLYDVFFVIDNSPDGSDESSYFVMITPDLAQAEIYWNLGPDDIMDLLYGSLPVDNGHLTVY